MFFSSSTDPSLLISPSSPHSQSAHTDTERCNLNTSVQICISDQASPALPLYGPMFDRYCIPEVHSRWFLLERRWKCKSEALVFPVTAHRVCAHLFNCWNVSSGIITNSSCKHNRRVVNVKYKVKSMIQEYVSLLLFPGWSGKVPLSNLDSSCGEQIVYALISRCARFPMAPGGLVGCACE